MTVKNKIDNERITVLFISLYTEMGGGEYAVYNLLKEIDRTKFRPIVMFNGCGEFVDKVESSGVETVFSPFPTVMLNKLIKPKILLSVIKSSIRISRFVKQNHIKIIQCSDVLSLFLIMIAFLSSRVRVIYNVIFYYEWMRMILFNIFSIFFVKKIIVNSSAIKDDIIRKTLLLSKKIEVIYPGISLDIFRSRKENEENILRKELGIDHSVKLIGMVGRFEPSKGHKFFLRAIAHVRQKCSDVKSVIIGEALFQEIFPFFKKYHEEVLEDYKCLNLGESVIFLPHRNDIPEVMRCLDVLVCPSLYEGYGLVILEALASGIPIVASRTVGALEVVHDLPGVFISEAGDEISIAKQILNAIEYVGGESPKSNADLNFKKIQARLQKHTWSEYAFQMEQIYSSVVI